MTNPYINYYQNQIGSGIPGFRGIRNQKGYGFLSSLLSKTVVPLFKSGLRLVNPSTIVKTATQTLKNPGFTSGSTVADEIARLGGTATGSLISSLQKGSGRTYKKRKPKKKKSVKRRKPKKTHKKRVSRTKKQPKKSTKKSVRRKKPRKLKKPKKTKKSTKKQKLDLGPSFSLDF